MAYSELIKNFDSIREYMREFFVYGFRSREEFADKKSLRSYDNEKRRIESYLGDYVSFRTDNGGKQFFISMASRDITHNPLYEAYKAKSFTDKDITLHFIVFDLLGDGVERSISQIIEEIEENYLSEFENPMSFDESTIRKKLKEYTELGIIIQHKEGKVVKYTIPEDIVDITKYKDAIRYFTEENILGVIGSFLEDKYGTDEGIYTFKNHYIMNAYDSEIVEQLLLAIHEKRGVHITNVSKRGTERRFNIIPLKIYVSTVNGRQYIISRGNRGDLMSFRIDYIKKVEIDDVSDAFDEAMAFYESKRDRLWGVNILPGEKYEHIEMDIKVEKHEHFIVNRLKREKRCGTICEIEPGVYRYSADVYDANELMPWIRTFIGRIIRLESDNELLMGNWEKDMDSLRRMYEDK